MKTIKYYILIAFVLLAGCENNQRSTQDTQLEQVSEKIEEIRVQSEPQPQPEPQMQTQPQPAAESEPLIQTQPEPEVKSESANVPEQERC
jgi:hypothetical protein